jgi:hypothetical protein
MFFKDTLPKSKTLTPTYCPGSITLNHRSLSIDDFRNDFEINVIGAVKFHPEIFTIKKGTNPSIGFV